MAKTCDAEAPLACTISATEIPERTALVDRLRAALTGIERTPHGMLLRFPADAAVVADARRFALEEKRCCGSWEFEIMVADNTVTLRWDGPPDAEDLVDRLLEFLNSNQPAESFVGLL